MLHNDIWSNCVMAIPTFQTDAYQGCCHGFLSGGGGGQIVGSVANLPQIP